MKQEFNKGTKESQVFSLTAAKKNGYQLLQLSGKMVYEYSDVVRQELLGTVANNTKYVIDTAGLRQIDSTGLGALITFGREVKGRQGKVVFIIQQEFIKELFLIAKFNLVFPMAEGEEQAVIMLDDNDASPLSLSSY